MASTSKTKRSNPYDSEPPSGSGKHKKDLTVRDEQGRQRFHGAFTGGFSAGYFNTVGSVEGFQPKKFISRRNDPSTSSSNDDPGTVGRRGSKFTHKPEDYMDEEDFSEFGIAPNKAKVGNESESANLSDLSGSRGLVSKEKTVTGALTDLMRPVQLSVGEKILRKMKYNTYKRNIQLTGDCPTILPSYNDSGSDTIDRHQMLECKPRPLDEKMSDQSAEGHATHRIDGGSLQLDHLLSRLRHLDIECYS